MSALCALTETHENKQTIFEYYVTLLPKESQKKKTAIHPTTHNNKIQNTKCKPSHCNCHCWQKERKKIITIIMNTNNNEIKNAEKKKKEDQNQQHS